MDFSTAYEQLKQGQVGSAYVLYGPERLFVDQFVNRLIQVTEADEAVRFDYEEDGVEAPLLELQTVSLFSQSPIVVIENCTALLSTGKAGGQAETLEAYLQKPLPNRVLVLTVAAEKLDERKKLTKAAKRHLLIPCQTPKSNIALKLIQQFANERQWSVDAKALPLLLQKTGSVTLAVNELQKLAIYALNRRIESADVDVLVPKTVEETVFDWVDHVAKGDLAYAVRNLSDMARQGYDPLALMAMLVRQFRMIWHAIALTREGMRIEEIAKVAKVHPFAMRVAEKQAKYFSLTNVEQILCLAADCEYDIKRGKRDPQHAVELLMLACARSTSRKERAQ